MRKIAIMLVFLLLGTVAFAQTDSTAMKNSGKLTDKEKASMKSTNDKNQSQNAAISAKSKNTGKKMSNKTPETTTTRERANGTTGVQDFPDTQGAGTGTGNDSRKNPSPGQPEKLTK